MKTLIYNKKEEKKSLVIAGPCSAESREQVWNTAQELIKNKQTSIFRAGVWKPRTRPGNFEGLGAIALPWLQEVSKILNLPYCTEVADAKQLEAALKHDVSMIWIGARTTASPFAVQQLADALKGVDIPVYIKNPTNPDIELWMGAIERVIQAGIKDIGLIHRGFSIHGSKDFRNPPLYHLAIDIKRRFPEFPFIMDPSHIAGKRALIPELIQHSLDLSYDGIMVEVHPSPDDAWSDAAQQLTPNSFTQILGELQWKQKSLLTEEHKAEMDKFRKELDQIDEQLITTLEQRMMIAEKIGIYKKKHKLTILQMDRLNETLERIFDFGTQHGLSKDFLQQYFYAVHMESIKHQQRKMN